MSERNRTAYMADYMRTYRAKRRQPLPEMECRRCGKTFTPRRADNGGYCTANCSSAHGQHLRRVVDPRPCEWCEGVFQPRHRDAAACSRPCVYALQVLRRHGLSAEGYRAMLVAQDLRCAICKRVLGDGRRDRHIDHDHETGEVRAILCPGCNLMLGHAKDNPVVLRAAADYLES